MDSSRTRVGLVGPVLLIGLGVLFLLENLGLLAWNVWEVALRLWPLLLVAWGLELMFGRRSAWGAAIAIILTLVILVGGVHLLGETRHEPGSETDIEVPLDQAKEAQIALEPAFAYLQVQPAHPTEQSLIKGRIVSLRRESIAQEIETSNRRHNVALRESRVSPIPLLSWDDDARWDVKLHPDVAYDLLIDMGAGKVDLQLEDLVMRSLDVEMGIGQTIVYLPDQGGYDASISGGLGHIILFLPDDLGIKLRVDVGIGPADVPNDFRRQGEAYVSPNYTQAEETIEIDLSLGIGSLEIR